MKCIYSLLLCFIFTTFSFAAVNKLDNYRGWKDCYEIQNKHVKIVLCPAAGGRILYYAIDGQNIIYENPKFNGILLENMKQYRVWPDGGRFDIGPETLPGAVRDPLMMGAWTAHPIDDYTVELRYESDNSLGLHVARRFKLARRGSKLDIVQTMTNYTDHPVARHYWGRVFCKGGGVVSLPLDDSKGWGAMGGYSAEGAIVKKGLLQVQLDDIVRKIGTDSHQGWIAYCVDNLEIKQKFKCFKGANYSDTDGYSTIFFNNEDLCEVEPVSPTIILKPGEAYTFKQQWKLSKIK